MKTYEVYARHEDGEGLTRIGAVEVEAGESVEAAVTKLHGEDWLEMVAIPADGISWAIGEEAK